jgi:hypothetical protein
MPTKRRKLKSSPATTKRTHRRTMKGKGPVGDWFKKAVRTVHDFVKDKQLISKGLSAVAPLAGPYSSHLNTASSVAKTLGYGKKSKKSKTRKTKRRRRR